MSGRPISLASGLTASRSPSAYGGQSIRLDTRFPGSHWTSSMLAAIAGGLACKLDLEACVGAIAEVEPVFGRYSVHQVPAGPVFVLDSYKAPLWTVPEQSCVSRDRTRAAQDRHLRDVADYAGNASRTYRKVARQALAIADRVIFVGPHASHAEADRADAGDRLLSFPTTYEASRFVPQQSEPASSF